jgi:hypothetical protein
VTLDDILQTLRDRDAVLTVRDGSLRYVGVSPLAPDDPLRVAIRERRSRLIALLSAPQPDGSPDHLANPITESMPDCPDHQQEGSESPPRPCVNPGMLMTVGHYHGYPRLPLKRGVWMAEGATAWRTFTRTADADMLALAAEAARATWSADPMTNDLYYVPPSDPDEPEPCRNENGACQGQQHDHFDADVFIDDHRAGREDAYVVNRVARGLP